jgi:2,3-dihydroxy-p-cumate/2,3-dihydroxybenzoate 3,4-dioxygenase
VIDLLDIRYVRLGTRDLDGAARFASDLLGLEPVRATATARWFRSDHRDHTLAYFDGAPDDHTVGFELRSDDELEAAAAALSNTGLAVREGNGAEC